MINKQLFNNYLTFVRFRLHGMKMRNLLIIILKRNRDTKMIFKVFFLKRKIILLIQIYNRSINLKYKYLKPIHNETKSRLIE